MGKKFAHPTAGDGVLVIDKISELPGLINAL